MLHTFSAKLFGRICLLTHPLPAILLACGLLTGFAAQVPSPPPAPVSPAAPAPAASTPAAPAVRTQQAEPGTAPGRAATQTPPPAPQTGSAANRVASPVAENPEAQTPPPALAAQSLPMQPALLPDLGTPPGERAQTAPLDPATVDKPLAALSYLDYVLDPSSARSPAAVAAEADGMRFTPLDGPLPRATGVVWLRLQLSPMPTGMHEQLYLHLGSLVPGAPSAWMTRPGLHEPVIVRPDGNNTYPILYSQTGGTLLIRLDGWPGTGFAPWVGPLETEASDAAALGHYIALALLGLAALVCLLRGLIERREWRIWAGLFAFAALVQGIWGMPSLPDGRINIWDIPALIAPALALFILPHAGRHLMQPRPARRWLDLLFIAASLLGLCVGLLPLLPGQAWMLRYLPLWPLGIGMTAALTLAACVFGLPGCGRFLLACLLAALGAVPLLSLMPDQSVQFVQPAQAAWNSLAPLAGLAIAGLWLALVGGKPQPRIAGRRFGARRNARVAGKDTGLQLDLPDTDGADDIYIVNAPLEMPAPGKSARREANIPEPRTARSSVVMTKATLPVAMPEPAPARSAPPKRDQGRIDTEALIRLEEALRVPIDALMRESIALDMRSLPQDAKHHVRELITAGRTLTGIVSNLSRTGLPHPARVTVENALFDLPLLLRNAHAAVEEDAEARNLAVSWYVAPHLGRRYFGPAERLAHVLRLLMESAVQATDQGSIQLWARRVQESNNPGELVFTVADTGSGMPPERRNPLLPAHIWELVGENNGSLQIDSGPGGTSISFSVAVKALPAHGTMPAQPGDPADAMPEDADLTLPSLRIIVTDDVSSRRQLLAYMLEDLPHEVLEARTAAETVAIHAEIPARMIIFDGSLPEKELIDTVAAIRSLDGERELPPTSLLALADHEAQGDRIRRAGVDHILYKPLARQILRQAVLHMAPVPGMDLPPLPHTPAPSAPAPSAPAPSAPAPSAPAPSALAVPQETTAEQSPAVLRPSSQPQADTSPLTLAPPTPVAEPPLAQPGVEPARTPQPADTGNSPAPQALELADPADVEPTPAPPKETQDVPLPRLTMPVPDARRPQPAAPVATPSAALQKPAPQRAESTPLGLDGNDSAEAADSLPVPGHTRSGKEARKGGLFERLLGVLPRRRAPLPDVAAAKAPESPAPGLPASRSVGEPRPLVRTVQPASEPAPASAARPKPRIGATYAPPRLTNPSDDSLLSENGVGEPMPIVKPAAVQAPAPHSDGGEPLSAHSVRESVPLHTTPPAAAEAEKQARIETVEDSTAPPLLSMWAPADSTDELGTPLEKAPPLPPLDLAMPGRQRVSLLDLIQSVEPTQNATETFDVPAPMAEHAPQPAPEPELQDDDGDAVVMELLSKLDTSLDNIQVALGAKDTAAVIAATGGMADQAEQFGLHVLARLARSMQDMAGEPEGLAAVEDTMPDLQAAVERNRASFTAR